MTILTEMGVEKMILMSCWFAFLLLSGTYLYLSRQLKKNIISKYLSAFQYTTWFAAVGALGGLILTRSWAFSWKWGFALSVWVWVGFALWAQLRVGQRLLKTNRHLESKLAENRDAWNTVNVDLDNEEKWNELN